MAPREHNPEPELGVNAACRGQDQDSLDFSSGAQVVDSSAGAQA